MKKKKDNDWRDEAFDLGSITVRALDRCEANLTLKDTWIQKTFYELTRRLDRLAILGEHWTPK